MSASAPALEAAVEQLGPCGLYQRYTALLLCLPNVLAAMYSLNYIFVAGQVPFRCGVPECEGEGGGGSYEHAAAQALLPAEPCRRHPPLQPGLHTCARDRFHPNLTVPCDTFLYQNHDTIFAEFELGCRERVRTLVGSVRNAALPVALVLTGYVSDACGRRPALVVFSSCAAALGLLKGFSVNYQMYLALEFLEAALGHGFNSAAYVMMVELARPPLRAVVAGATGVAYGAGGVLLAALAWRVRYWRRLLWTAHGLALLLPLYWLLVDESWRWLHARGRADRLDAGIRRAARWNKVILDEEVMKRLHESVEPESSAWRSAVRSRALRARLALCGWCWAAASFVSYGLSIRSVPLSGDRYVDCALNMAMEIVASLLLMMALDRLGRKWSIFGAFLLCGVACVAPYFLSHADTGLGLFFLGKLSVTFAFNALYVFTAEVFPTRARSSALAACSLLGRLGSVLAPQTPLLSGFVQALLYGSCSALTALAVLAAPETRRAALPADVAAAERMRRAGPDPAPAPPPPPPPPLRRVISADS